MEVNQHGGIWKNRKIHKNAGTVLSSKKEKKWMIINIQNNHSDGMHLHLISDFVNGDS